MIRDKSENKQIKLPKGVIAVAPPSFRRERALIKRGVWPVAGCDEAGRGPLAGPVVAAAVVLDPKRIPKGIDDSKRLTATISCAPRCGRSSARSKVCRNYQSTSLSMAATGLTRRVTARL
jgi:ribonuclease HII